MGYYNTPGEFQGLTKLGALELSNEAYQYDLIGLWKDEKGRYYLGTDSGCSCPTPWENMTRDALTGPLSAAQAREESTSIIDAARPGVASWREGVDEWEAKEFLDRIG